MRLLLLLFLPFCLGTCAQAQPPAEPEMQKIVIDSTDTDYGYYLRVEPEGDPRGVLVLLPGFGQQSEDVFLDTEFHHQAFKRGIVLVAFAGKTKLTADTLLRERLNAVFRHVLENNEVARDRFVLGGYSAGGVIALRYAELCHQYPDRYPIQPEGVFLVDSPVDLYHSWDLQEEILKNNLSEISVAEAEWLTKFYRAYYGATPSENPERFMDLSPFSIDPQYGTHEQHLKNVAVRAYHDIDIAWRLKNRNQTARFDNYIATSELINRLLLMGNERAEFIQTFQTGFRRNGERHPHSWSIVEEDNCLNWIEMLLKGNE